MTATRVFTATPAVREQVPLLIGLVSPSGGGKTYSALRLATGIQQVIDGEIVLIDTENRRALHYADQFKFTHVPFEPPFNPDDYLQVMRYAAARKPAVIIVDSMTHEHTGEGGYLDTAERIIDRIAGDDYAKRDKAKFAGWAKVGPQRTRLIEGIKQISGNMIFCWRGKEKTKPVRSGSGKMEVVEQGLMAIGGTEWIYEMTINCLLPARSNGVPDWEGVDPGERLQMKLPQQFRNLFRPGTVLDEGIGQKMAEWAIGGSPPVPQPTTDRVTTAPAPPPPLARAGAASPKKERRSGHTIHAGVAVSKETPSPTQSAETSELAMRQELYDRLNAAAQRGRAEFVKEWNQVCGQWKDWPDTRRFMLALHQDAWKPIYDEVDIQAAGLLKPPVPPADEEREAAEAHSDHDEGARDIPF
jgi:hypothetical protein